MKFEYSTPEQVLEFFEEFGATKDTIRRDVQYLISWMKQVPHLPKIEDEDLIQNILLRAKNNVEKAKKLIDRYYSARAKMPEIFRNRGDEFRADMEKVRKHITFCPFPKLTSDGYRLMLIMRNDINLKDDEFPSPIAVLKYAQIINDFSLKYDKVRGVILIYDWTYGKMELMKYMIAYIKKGMELHSYVTPIRYYKIYVLNAPSFASAVINLSLSFVKKEEEKVVLWNTKDSALSAALPRGCLPSDYGGTLPSTQELEDIFINEYEKYFKYIESQEGLQADLTLKPIERKPEEDSMYGLDGTFKQLTFD